MIESGSALPGTAPLILGRQRALYDYYRTQYAATLRWLDQALADCAKQRDQMRAATPAWCASQRQSLAQLTGAAAFAAIFSSQASNDPLSSPASWSQIELPVVHEGMSAAYYADPAQGAPIGVVILGGMDDLEPPMLAATAGAYLSAGLRVVLPLLARPTRTFAEDGERHWITFPDDELFHLFAFVIGGSLAGLEAVELLTLARTVGKLGGRDLPVVLDLRGRAYLSALVAAALAPTAFDLLLLHPEAARVDHQEAEGRVNTIWGFHRHFDGLTLLTLAEATALLFVDDTPTPSTLYSRAVAWAGVAQAAHPQRRCDRLVDPTPGELATTIATRLGRTAATQPDVHPFSPMPELASNYRRMVEGKFAYLSAQHQAAVAHRSERYDLAAMTPAQYRQRIAESIERVTGPLLPVAADQRPRTRLVSRQETHDVYFVLLEGVTGVDTAGYLLIPKGVGEHPAVICQHGLGGRPEVVAGLAAEVAGGWVYDAFAHRLAQSGYVTFAPFMNWGWAQVSERDALVKRAYALGCTPNRFEVAQLQSIVDFLQSRPEVKATQIAFYGLSYGGHASLWLTAHEPRLAAVITAGHFNHWARKLTSLAILPPLLRPAAYISVDEGLDMFNYNILNEVDHAELATRYAPRPYLVENGLLDTVTPTAWVDAEFVRVRTIYQWLGAAEDALLEHFPGPHRIWAGASFAFLHKYLSTPPIA